MSADNTFNALLGELRQTIAEGHDTLRGVVEKERDEHGTRIMQLAQATERGELTVAKAEALTAVFEQFEEMMTEVIAAPLDPNLSPEKKKLAAELQALLRETLKVVRSPDGPLGV